MKEISLDDMRLFVSVVQAGSLSHASALTGVPVSRLSRRLTQLERNLGTQLLNRGKKGVTLNELGERFFIHAQSMLQQAQTAIDSVQQGLAGPSGQLKISVAADIFHGLFAPHMAAYLAENPNVNAEIQFTHEKINMIQDGIDIAIRAGAIENDNVVARKLPDIRFGLFATPQYLTAHPPIESPQDLYRHDMIVQHLSLPWVFQHENERMQLLPNGKISGNDFTLIAEMIALHAGIGLLPTFLARKRSNLVQILPNWRCAAVPLSLIYYKNRGAVPTVRSFVAFMEKALGG